MSKREKHPVAARFATRAAMLVVAYLAFMVVVALRPLSSQAVVAFVAGLAVAWVWPRVWRWSDGERYARTQKAAPPANPKVD